MIAEPQTLEKIVVLVKQLSPEDRLRLMEQILQTLIPASMNAQQPLEFGKYHTGRMSTFEDFALAEWRPTDEELDGE